MNFVSCVTVPPARAGLSEKRFFPSRYVGPESVVEYVCRQMSIWKSFGISFAPLMKTMPPGAPPSARASMTTGRAGVGSPGGMPRRQSASRATRRTLWNGCAASVRRSAARASSPPIESSATAAA